MGLALRNIASFALLAILTIVALWKVDFSPLLAVGWPTVAMVAVPVTVFTVARTYVFQIVLGSFGIKLRFREWFGLGIYASLINYVLPFRSGLLIKAVYLKRVHAFSYSRFIGLHGAMFFVQLLTIVLLMIPVLVVLGADWSLILALSAVATLTFILPIFLRHGGWGSQNRMLVALDEIYRSFSEVIHARKGAVVGKIIGNGVIGFVATATALYIALEGMGAATNFLGALTIALFMMFLNVATITPGNFGVQEFAAGYLAAHIGLDFDIGFLATLVVRIVSIGMMLALSPFFLRVISGLSSRNTRPQVDS